MKEHDLLLTRDIDVPRPLVWKAWTEPQRLMKWFCPRPWRTVEAILDVRPGGRFYTVMQSPEGERFPGDGAYLEVIPERKLVWTSLLQEGWRPAPAAMHDLQFTAVLTLEDIPGGTRYAALAMHKTPEDSARHEAMGFYHGWGAALDQLVAMIKEEGA
jgi:uncharacterized protein YndB with AHSA1/START domain